MTATRLGRPVRSILLALLGLSASLAAAAVPPSPEAALAPRFETLAQVVLREKPEAARWRQAAVLLEAAHRCDPAEARYLRLLADARLQLQDSEGALRALNGYRKLRPDDCVAQLEVIERHLGRMESITEQINYLKGLLPVEAVPAEVRSVVAWRCATLLTEKKQSDQAMGMIEQALKLNPLNLAALSAKYQAVAPKATAGERVGLLLGMLRANPVQPGVLSLMAREAAQVGLTGEAVWFYEQSAGVAMRGGIGLSPEFALEYASALMLAEQPDRAGLVLDQLIEANGEDYPALILRLLIARSKDQKEKAEKLRLQARNAVLNRLAVVQGKLGVKGASTRPAAEGGREIGDLAGDAALFKSASDPALRAAYLQAVGDVAWFEVYLNNRPDEAERLLKHFTALAEPDDEMAGAFAARLAGWVFLAREGKQAEAKVKLSAVAERDPMAALGLLRTYGASPEEQAQAKAEAAKLLAREPAGVVGAMLAEAVRERGVKVVALPSAEPVAASLKRFPRELLRIIDNPSAFYSLRAEPLKVAYSFGEPMLVRVTIQNISNYELTIGPDGILRPDLWIQPQVGGLYRGVPTDICVDRITDRLVLKPRQSINRIVRIDQGRLGELFGQRPTSAIMVMLTIRTNPTTTGAGPGGLVAPASRIIERSAFAMNPDAFNTILEGIASGSVRDRLRNMDFALAVSSAMLAEQKDNAEVKAKTVELLQKVEKTRSDSEPSVRAWAAFLYAFFGPDLVRDPATERLLLDDSWEGRLLGLFALSKLPPARQKTLAEPLSQKDKEAIVREYAGAAVELSGRRAETRPAGSRPSTSGG